MKDVKLSKNFSLSEMTKSVTASKLSIDNIPNEQQIKNLELLVINVLQPIREHFGIPFRPSSGFRSTELNTVISKSRHSQHVHGMAADIEVPTIDNAELAKWIRRNLTFDQVILESHKQGVPASGWVHVSYSQVNNRNMAFNIKSDDVDWLEPTIMKVNLEEPIILGPAKVEELYESSREPGLREKILQLTAANNMLQEEYTNFKKEKAVLKDSFTEILTLVNRMSIRINKL